MKAWHLLLPFVTIVLAGLPARADSSRRPNILYFYVDDMGWGSIGPNGQAERRAKGLPSVKTPNLDRLAAEGVNFTRGYGCFVCSPARSSQQSGFHQGHTFADRNDPNNAKKAMRADDVLMGDALSAAGYVTGYWGKWGYGGSKDRDSPTIDNVQTLPTSHGYQHVLAELHHVRAHTFFQPTLWSAPAPKGTLGGIHLRPNSLAKYQGNADYPTTPALQNHPDYPATAYCDDSYAFAAMDFVRRQSQIYNQTGTPFFGLLAVQIPHAPFDEITRLPEWDAAYRDDPHFDTLAKQSQQWATMVTRIDAHFGNLLAALEDPNHDGDTSDSVADNTLVIFQSDNGGPGGRNNVEFDANGGLRGTKGKIQEGGIRVPLVMRWPAMIHSKSKVPSGAHLDTVVDVTDLLPTFCELAGTESPLGIDGVSIAPLLTGQGEQRPRDFIIHEAGNGQSIIRGNHKLVRDKKGGLALYDLQSDRGESTNLAVDDPERVGELETLLIGERVTEPKGFANTYHRWLGRDGGDASDPEHWSDYVYANAGVTYMKDDGGPQLSWVARMVNDSKRPNTAVAREDLDFLALEIRGGEATQSLELAEGTTLTGRNEIRIGDSGILKLSGAKVSTLRWVDVSHSGEISGKGTIDGAVYNRGTINVVANARLRCRGDFYQFAESRLVVAASEKGFASISVQGRVRLDGELAVKLTPGFNAVAGQSVSILKAAERVSEFSNPDQCVTASDGTRFRIVYEGADVKLVLEEIGLQVASANLAGTPNSPLGE